MSAQELEIRRSKSNQASEPEFWCRPTLVIDEIARDMERSAGDARGAQRPPLERGSGRAVEKAEAVELEDQGEVVLAGMLGVAGRLPYGVTLSKPSKIGFR